ncbi:MAG: 4-hydroxy-tetrahydrodipicolinate synthase [Candidatus Cloacimonetes bacterium]|nr:4-hydroxy-tetrahydrodipicolinate synthase [Candidatus Cloacimonadota bacterium]
MLQGSFVALVTPFHNGEIDYNKLEGLLQFHLKNKTDGILLLGTTAEASALANDEKESLLRFAIRILKGIVPIMVGTGSNNLNQTLASTRKAFDLGADYALIITPYYIKPTQQGLYEYFKAIATKVSEPIVIYNVPGRTGVNISSSTTVRLAREFKNIVGIKEASADLIQATEIIRDSPSDFSVMSGEDALVMPTMALGAKGCISVTANILPAEFHNLTALCLQGEYSKAMHLHQELLEINRKMFIETNPIPVKEALAMMGLLELEFRLPMCPLLPANRSILEECLKRYKLF